MFIKSLFCHIPVIASQDTTGQISAVLEHIVDHDHILVQSYQYSKASVGGVDDIGAEIDAVSLHCYGTLTLALFSCPQWTMNTVHMCEKTQWLVSTVDGAGV